MKKMLHIQVIPQLSGVQRISLEIFKNLSGDEYDKWILFGTENIKGDVKKCESEFRKAGVKIVYCSSLRREIGLHDIKAFFYILDLCKKERFDIVHTHSTKPGVLGRLAARLAGVPYIIHTVHGLAFHKYIKFPLWHFYWALEMFATLFCDNVVLVNKFYGKYYKWTSKKVSTIYNGIDFSTLKIKNSLSMNEKNDKIKVLTVGRLDKQKDPLTLLRAANEVLKIRENVFFSVIGGGELYGMCKEYISENSLENRIKLEGWQNDVSKFYLTHDIFVSSSIYEAFGLVFVEAGYCKLPIVATNVEGIPEVVVDGLTGLLCDEKDYIGIANNLLKLIDNIDLRIFMGRQSQKRAIELFSVERMNRQYKNMYDAYGI